MKKELKEINKQGHRNGHSTGIFLIYSYFEATGTQIP